MTDRHSNDTPEDEVPVIDDIIREAFSQRVQEVAEPRSYWELPGLIHQPESKKRWFDMQFGNGHRSPQIGFVLAGIACLLVLGFGLISLTGRNDGGDVQVATDPTLPDPSQEAEEDAERAAEPEDQATPEEQATPEVLVLGPDGSGVGELVYLPFPDDDPEAECRFGNLGHRNAAGELHSYDNIEPLGNVRYFEGGDGQVAVVSNCEELVDTVIIASSSLGDTGPPELAVFPIPGDWFMPFRVDAQIWYFDTVWLADIDRGNGLEEVRFELDRLQIVPTSEPSSDATPASDPAAPNDVAFVCADGSTGTVSTDTEDVEQIDDYINTIDLCEGVGGLQSISFEASCGDFKRTVTVGAEGGVPDIATIDYCE